MSTYLLLDVGVARYMTTHGWASPPCSPQEPGSGCAGTGPWASTTEGLRPCVLLAVELDDQLFLDLRVDHLAGRQRVHKDLHLAGDRLQPRRNGPAARLGVGDHERRHLARLLADLDDVVLAHPAGRDVDLLAVDQEVAVLDQLAAGGNAASAFDFGGEFAKFLEFNAWMRERMLANDPRTRDIRSMIHTLDGATVHRIDRTGKQSDSGDSTHLTHTHFSFFRDSLGRRDKEDNFLGLLKEFFEGSEDDMPFATAPEELPTGKNVVKSYSIPPVNSGGIPWGDAFLSVWADLFGGQAAFRLAVGDGKGFNVIGERITLESGKLFNLPLAKGVRGLS